MWSLQLRDLSHLIGDAVFTISLCLPRILVVLSMIPVFTSRTLPPRCRDVLAVVLALIPAFALYPHMAGMDRSFPMVPMLVLKEAAIGLLLGLLLGLPFWLFESIGNMVDNQRGATFAQQMDPSTGADDLPVGRFTAMSFGVLFVLVGALSALVKILTESFMVLPVYASLPTLDMALLDWFVKLYQQYLLLFVLLASPVVIGMLLVDFSLAIMSVYAPNMQVYNLVGGIKTVLGLFLLAVYARFLYEFGVTELFTHLDLVSRFVAAGVSRGVSP
ncbi:MAG: hypothetical protein RIR70_360 [Pseudomonadota bacterium]|jgi:type III secretion protein T